MVLSGIAMIVVGGWLAAQAIGGNLAGRIRSWANRQIGAGPTTTATTGGAASDSGRMRGGGTRTGGG